MQSLLSILRPVTSFTLEISEMNYVTMDFTPGVFEYVLSLLLSKTRDLTNDIISQIET